MLDVSRGEWQDPFFVVLGNLRSIQADTSRQLCGGWRGCCTGWSSGVAEDRSVVSEGRTTSTVGHSCEYPGCIGQNELDQVRCLVGHFFVRHNCKVSVEEVRINEFMNVHSQVSFNFINETFELARDT